MLRAAVTLSLLVRCRDPASSRSSCPSKRASAFSGRLTDRRSVDAFIKAGSPLPPINAKLRRARAENAIRPPPPVTGWGDDDEAPSPPTSIDESVRGKVENLSLAAAAPRPAPASSHSRSGSQEGWQPVKPKAVRTFSQQVGATVTPRSVPATATGSRGYADGSGVVASASNLHSPGKTSAQRKAEAAAQQQAKVRLPPPGTTAWAKVKVEVRRPAASPAMTPATSSASAASVPVSSPLSSRELSQTSSIVEVPPPSYEPPTHA